MARKARRSVLRLAQAQPWARLAESVRVAPLARPLAVALSVQRRAAVAEPWGAQGVQPSERQAAAEARLSVAREAQLSVQPEEPAGPREVAAVRDARPGAQGARLGVQGARLEVRGEQPAARPLEVQLLEGRLSAAQLLVEQLLVGSWVRSDLRAQLARQRMTMFRREREAAKPERLRLQSSSAE